MWQRFSERARRVVFFAQEEAGRLGEKYVSTEHLLLGITREPEGRSALALNRLGVSLDRIRREIERQVARGDGRTAGQDMQLTPRGKRVIDLAYDESRLLGNHDIGTEHLLLGLVREGEGLAGRVLVKLGVEIEALREAVRAVQSEDGIPGEGAAPSGPPSAVYRPARVGDLGVLIGERETVEVAADAAAYAELAASFAARDRHGYRELKGAERFFLVAAGTKIKRLATPAEERAAVGHGYLVRLQDGEFAGRTGWIAPAAFGGVTSDESPFPPED